MWAVLYNQPRNVARLLAAGAAPEKTDEEGRCAVHYAIADERAACLSELLSWDSTDPNQRDGSGRCPLHMAASNKGVECVTLLVQHPRISINCVDGRGATPLHWAAANAQTEMCCVLAQFGANLKATDTDGKTPLDHATERRHLSCAGALQDLERNAMAHIERLPSLPHHASNVRPQTLWQSAVAKMSLSSLSSPSSSGPRRGSVVNSQRRASTVASPQRRASVSAPGLGSTQASGQRRASSAVCTIM